LCERLSGLLVRSRTKLSASSEGQIEIATEPLVTLEKGLAAVGEEGVFMDFAILIEGFSLAPLLLHGKSV